MHRKILHIVFLIVVLLAYPAGRAVRAQAEPPVVQAVLFNSPICTFCHEIVEEDLLPIQERYGAQLDIFFVDVDTSEGQAVYQAFLDAYQIAGGVPLIVIQDKVVGGVNIKEQLPEVISRFLELDGADWPDIPGLKEHMAFTQAAVDPAEGQSGMVLIPSNTQMETPQFLQAGSGMHEATVRAILFFSPTCGHCHFVIDEILPPLQQKYGSRLEVLPVDASTETGYEAFLLVIEHYQLESAGVPFLLVGNQYLVGSIDIPERFPLLIDRHLAQGGLDWPEIPGLWDALGLVGLPAADAIQPDEDPIPPGQIATATAEPETTWIEQVKNNIRRDPGGNALSILVLAGMLVTLIAAATTVLRGTAVPADHKPVWLLPLLCVIGLGVAGYLAYVEVTFTEVVCGPVGDCNTVQQSAYARQFGILPIGVLGMAGYIAILAVRAGGWILKGRWLEASNLGILAMGFFGFLFSIYLTFLEPFVIGASCAWCLASAVLMTLIFWLSLKPGLTAWRSFAPMLAGFRRG